MPHHATGTFNVQLTPQPADGYADAMLMGRLTIDKTFVGDLVGTSRGQNSGTDELVGLRGTMTLDISHGVHRYTLSYTLPTD